MATTVNLPDKYFRLERTEAVAIRKSGSKIANETPQNWNSIVKQAWAFNRIPPPNIMALRNTLAVSFIIMMLFFGACSAVIYMVGDNQGWTSNEFHVGDEFIFNYKHDDDFVTLVIEQVNYDHRIVPSLALSDERGFTTLTFNIPGIYYVIWAEPGHCQARQKVKIKINAPELENSSSSSSPSPSPSPSDDMVGKSLSNS
ncbi:hypothetical protein DVH24_019372 [Malus domestica]|uniref:Phytocyanin domain-containing protein n=1 Tax=Malus domestica TaxID=3750 RepID=A0A498I2T5_MALDO|nr:hypothetical protein DVH24_019372 [Malus domestica]